MDTRHLPDARFYADVTILWSSNMRNVWTFGHEFGEVGYIVAGSDEDAWDELLSYVVEHDGPCDHGGDMTDEQRWAGFAGTDDSRQCDCNLTCDGRWVDPGYWWTKETRLRPEYITLAFEYKED